MLNRIINAESILKLGDLIAGSRNILITCHLSPDGDAMGSSLGLCMALKNIGKKAKVVVPDTPPKYLMFLPGATDIVVYSRSQHYVERLFASSELVFCLDYNEPKRIDLVADAMLASPAKKVMIDHHLNPADFPDVVISHPEESSTSVLVYRTLLDLGLGDAITADVAECLYTGMMTDTGNFSYNSNDPDLYEVIADMVRRGINKDFIYRKVYFSNSYNRLRLNGYALVEKFEVFPEHKAALITLTREEMNRFQDMLFQAAAAMKVKPVDIKEKAGQMMTEARELRQTIEKLKAREFVSEADQFLMSAKQVKGLKVFSMSRNGVSADDMRKMGDFLRDKDQSVVALMASVNEGKITFLAVCGKEAVDKGVKAGDIIKTIAPICGGKGGGKPDSAMGGGSDLLKLDDALAALDDFVNEKAKEQ